MGENEFFTNKELFMFMEELKKDMASLRNEMTETRTLIKQYNGLRTKVDDAITKANNIEAKLAGMTWAISIGVPVLTLVINILLKFI